MTAKITSATLLDAHKRIAQLSISAELAAIVDKRGTTIEFSNLISGGFTLNVINRIFVDPHLQDSASFDWLVCILAHEFCHVKQGYWVDSVEQELICYQLQARVCAEIGLDGGRQIYDRFLPLDPKKPSDLETALKYIIELAGGSVPTQTIYKSLPKFQPTGAADNFGAALKQLSAAGLAGIQSLQLLRSK